MSTLNPYFYAYNPELLAFENAWIKFIKHQELNTEIIKPEICASWQRCYAFGLDPLCEEKPMLLGQEEIKERLKENKELLTTVVPYMDSLYQMIRSSGFRVDFIDREGFILLSLCDGEALDACKKTNSFPGANRRECTVGTNAIGLSLLLKKPVQVAGAEHYLQILQRWACSAAPMIDENGEVLGVLNVTGRYELVHVHTLGLVSSMARAIENELYIQKVNKKIAASNCQLKATLETVTDGVVYIEKDHIMQINQEMCSLIGKTQGER